MGCDIHAVIEHKRYGVYHPWAIDVDFARWYLLFAYMAGVRNGSGSVVPVSSPRGLPTDTAAETRAFLADAGDHSASWLSLVELREVQRRLDVDEDGSIFPDLNAVISAMAHLEDPRLVFNFDN